MVTVNSIEFATHQDKYLELALKEQVFIKKGNMLFIIKRANESDEDEDEDEDDYADLEEAKARANDESTSADDFLQFLNGLR